MEIQKVKSTLKKISELLHQTDGHLSTLEKDLILSHLRNLYDEFLFYSPYQPKPIQPPSQPIVENESVSEISTPQNIEPPKIEVKSISIPGKFDFLFSFSKSKDLSEKLGIQSMSDLSKSFSLNDKLWYTNELFKKDSNEFQLSIQKLNTASFLEEAKSILVGLAEKNDWDVGEKKEAAIMFSKIVLTRFL
jgi:hypothetical protein